jgi:hemerythrin superfamily protein
MAETASKDVIDVILSQHQEIKSLLTQVASSKGEAADSSFCELRRLVAVHETAEEEIVYPVLRTCGDEGKQIADARTKEEAEGNKVLFELEGMEAGSAEFMKTFEQFRKAVLDHAEHEEHEVMPLLRRSQEADRLQSMGRAFEVAEKAAPTHAHPHAPTSATGNIVTGPALAIMDRVRDALRAK